MSAPLELQYVACVRSKIRLSDGPLTNQDKTASLWPALMQIQIFWERRVLIWYNWDFSYKSCQIWYNSAWIDQEYCIESKVKCTYAFLFPFPLTAFGYERHPSLRFALELLKHTLRYALKAHEIRVRLQKDTVVLNVHPIDLKTQNMLMIQPIR